MEQTISAKSGFLKSPIKTIIYAWLIAGTLDITSAIINFLVVNKTSLLGLFQYIASGLFGTKAFDGGLLMALAGLLIHYTIAFTWTIIFFFVYPRIKFLSFNIVLTGFAYGIIIWFFMNRIALKLSNVHHINFSLTHDILGTLYLMFCIGLPISIIVSKYYEKREVGLEIK